MSSSTRIEIVGFRKRFKDVEVRIDTLTLDASLNVLLGANGSGKTTLLKAVAGLLKHEGVISFEGTSIYAEERCVLPGEMKTVDFLSALRSLEHTDPDRLKRLLAHFDCERLLDRRLDALSKGMRQKINLIVTLMVERDVYLLDEPLSGLDKTGRSQLTAWLTTAAETFVCATHLESSFTDVKHKRVRL